MQVDKGCQGGGVASEVWGLQSPQLEPWEDHTLPHPERPLHTHFSGNTQPSPPSKTSPRRHIPRKPHDLALQPGCSLIPETVAASGLEAGPDAIQSSSPAPSTQMLSSLPKV